jgi:predicted nucleic acid-binding protein
VVAALVDSGAVGAWAEGLIAAGGLFAPHVMPFEVANVLRRVELAGDVSAETAALAHDDLRQLTVRLVDYQPLVDRVWEVRSRASAYDASYVALAELLDVPLATLDVKLSRTPNVGCAFVIPG